MINLNQLYTFYVLAKSGSFSKASERLFITEPAVFMQIKSLEQHIGYKLLDRIGKELRLTELGQIVFEYCDKIFVMVQELNNVITDFKDMRAGILKIGMAKVIMNYLMPPLLCGFMEKYPHIKIQLEENSTMDLIDGLMNGTYELVISARTPYPKKTVEFIPFTSSRLYLVGSPRDPLSKRGVITIEDLKSIPLIMKDKRSATRYITETTLERIGIKPLVSLESGSMELIKDLIKEGKGFSFLSDLAIREELRRNTLSIIKVKELDLSYDVGIFHLKKRTLSVSAKRFLEYLDTVKRDSVCEVIEYLEKKREPSVSFVADSKHLRSEQALVNVKIVANPEFNV